MIGLDKIDHFHNVGLFKYVNNNIWHNYMELAYLIKKHQNDKEVHVTDELKQKINTLATKEELNDTKILLDKLNNSLSNIQNSSMNVPEKLTDFINDAGFISRDQILSLIRLQGYITRADIANDTVFNKFITAQLLKDRHYLTAEALFGYATQDWVKQYDTLKVDLSEYATKEQTQLLISEAIDQIPESKNKILRFEYNDGTSKYYDGTLDVTVLMSGGSGTTVVNANWKVQPDGYWYYYDVNTDQWVNSNIRAVGKDGKDGINGTKGEKGDPGQKGEKGDPGSVQNLLGSPIRFRGEYSTGITYLDGNIADTDGVKYQDIVTYNNLYYICKKSTTAAPSSISGDQIIDNAVDWTRMSMTPALFTSFLMANNALLRDIGIDYQ